MASPLTTARSSQIKRQFRQQQRTIGATYLALIILGFFIVQVMEIYGPMFGAALLLLIAMAGLALFRPALALSIAIVLTIVGDQRAMSWWPVARNFSSRESVLYFSNGLTFNPLELLLAVVVTVWLVNSWLSRDTPPVEYGPFWRPLLVFSIALVFGLIWGVGRGGDLRVAMFEVRPLAYIPLVYLVTTNLFTSLHHYHRLLWGVLLALTVESLHGLLTLPTEESASSPVEHTAALHMNLLFILLLATTWFGTQKIGKRALLLLLTIPTLMLFINAERRSAVVGLVIGSVFLAIVLFTRDRSKFFRSIPVITLIALVYVGAFWNAENSSAGFPAQAIKIIAVPDASSEKDASSDLYREIENFNLNATIRRSPITGIGFGQPFLQPIQLPALPSFEFAPYIPHNSLLWVWTQVGFVGFIAFLQVFGLGVAAGIRTARRIEDPDDAALVATLAAYIPMLLVVSFVEISFDAQTTVLFAIALASVGSAERLLRLSPIGEEPRIRRGVPTPARRHQVFRSASGKATGLR